jgi:hypothetical protein
VRTSGPLKVTSEHQTLFLRTTHSAVVIFILHFTLILLLMNRVTGFAVWAYLLCLACCQVSFGVCWAFPEPYKLIFWLQNGIMQTHDEETRKFFKHSSVTCVLSPRYASSKLSIFKQQACFMLWFISFPRLFYVSVFKFCILYHSFHPFLISF